MTCVFYPFNRLIELIFIHLILRILFLYDRNAQLYCHYFYVFVFLSLYCLLNRLTFTEDDPMWIETFEYF